MSDTVIVLQEECILAASGKAGRRPKISRTDMIPTEVHTDPFEQWKRALLAYKEKEHPGSVKLVLPSNYSSHEFHRFRLRQVSSLQRWQNMLFQSLQQKEL